MLRHNTLIPKMPEYQDLLRRHISEYFGSILNNIVSALKVNSVDLKDEIVIENNNIVIPNKYILLVDSFKVLRGDGSITDVVGWELKNGGLVLPVIHFSYDDIYEFKVIAIEFPSIIKVLMNNNKGFGPALSFA